MGLSFWSEESAWSLQKLLTRDLLQDKMMEHRQIDQCDQRNIQIDFYYYLFWKTVFRIISIEQIQSILLTF